MQSLRVLQRKYTVYEANPARFSKQGEKRGSAATDEETLTDAKDEERLPKEEDVSVEKGSDPHYVTWHGDNDPMNPRNWTNLKKWSVLVLVSGVAWIVGFSSSVFSADTAVVSELTGISLEVAEFGTALYLIGFGVGPLFFGPMSEAFGRSPVYFGSFLAYLLFQLGPALGQTAPAIIIPRFFAGFFGSTPLSNAGGSINDMFNPLDRTLAFSVFAAMPFLGPVMGPVIAGACTVAGTSNLDNIVDWRWVYWFTLIFGGAYLILMILVLPETEAKAILALKAKAIRRQTGDNDFYCDQDQRSATTLQLIITSMQSALVLLFTEPIIMAISLYLLIIYTILYMDFEGYAFLFAEETYHFNLVQVGIAFLFIAAGIVLVACTAPLQLMDYRPFYNKAVAEGKPMASPEIRLRPLLLGCFLVPIGVFWMAWTARPGISWIVPVLAGVPFGSGLLLVLLTTYQYLIDSYGPLAASALAASTLFRYVGAGSLVMVVRPMYQNLAYEVDGQAVYAWPLSLVGFLSVACLPIPYILYFGAGKWLRHRSPKCVDF